MLQVLPKIVVWAVLIGAAYFAFGPDALDSSGTANPLDSAPAAIFLPPAKPALLIDYERRLSVGQLEPAEMAGYRALSTAYQGRFWDGSDMSVEEALSGVKRDRARRLADILGTRGLSQEERAIFFTVLRRDHPSLLEDRE